MFRGHFPTDVNVSSTSVRSHLKAPSVAELSVQIEVHLHHQQPVPGPGQAGGAAAVGRSHVAGTVEMAEVVVSCTVRRASVSLPAINKHLRPSKLDSYLFYHHRT